MMRKNNLRFIFIIALLLTTRVIAEDTPTEDANIFETLKNSEDFTSKETETKAPTKDEDLFNELKADEPKTVSEEPKKEISKEQTTDIPQVQKERKEGEDLKVSTLEEQDDLQSLKDDVGEVVKKENTPPDFTKKNAEAKAEEDALMDEEAEKKMLLELAQKVKGRISNQDWNSLVKKSKLDKYEIKSGDTLKSIAKTIFGSESYYTKIWALNPHITNPNELEVGTILTFDSGDSDTMPNVAIGEFSDDEVVSHKKGAKYSAKDDKNLPSWIKERKKLIDQGVYFQFASEETYEDLERLDKLNRNNEWEKYDPPVSNIVIQEPGEQYDSSGFDKNSRIIFNYKEGFFLNSFVTTNVIQDLGEIEAAKNESVFIHKFDTIYVKFDKSAKVKPGDLFSVYTNNGQIKHPISDRTGFAYTTTAQIKIIRAVDQLWECYVFDQSGIVQRKDRITVYTPKIGKIAKTFGKRNVEAAIIGSYRDSLTGNTFGDVLYLDRGRADGVELGNIFDVYSFVDRGTDKKISASPTYKIGELTVINITDNFATALVTNSKSELSMGSIALMRTQEEAMRANQIKNKDKLKNKKQLENKSLEELDVELNLDDVSQDILNKADKVQLTEDEIEELDRQERDKSVIKNQNKDVKELDRLESEILDAEKSLNESKVDEDKFLEQQNLEDHEKKAKQPDPNAFESINEIEKDIGKKYLDEDINNKENPYGLTEFDLEEIDELLNTGSKSK